MIHLSRHRKGFGLLEVVFSTGIFILVIGSLILLNKLSLRNAAISIHRAQAYNLAQDGLEAVRQMRDTAWIDGIQIGSATEDWLAFAHDCDNDPVDPGAFAKVADNTNYEICFDSRSLVTNPNQSLNRFGLRPADMNDFSPTTVHSGTDHAYIVFDDPSAPSYYHRTIRIEPVPASNACDTVNTNYPGLQILKLNNLTGLPCTFGDVESHHFRKIVSKVEWEDFDKKWSVELSTILTNWRGN